MIKVQRPIRTDVNRQNAAGERGSLPTSVPRRTLLAVLGGALSSVAGCLGAPRAETPNPDVGVGSIQGEPPGEVELPVPREELVRGVGRDVIPAITDPVFGTDWEGVTIEVRREFQTAEGFTRTAEPRLRDDDTVIGVARNDEARAYPLRILNWHEVVNDTFGEPLLVTYCPLCRSAIVAERRVQGEETIFGVSGLLFKNDLVMYDTATDSLWSQILAKAIAGPLTGDTLSFRPFTVTTLGEWRDQYPDTGVLRPPPQSGTIIEGDGTRDYTTDPYLGYQQGDAVGLEESADEFEDDRLHPKAEVLGIVHGGVARAYALDDILSRGLITDEVGGLPVAVTTTSDGEAVAWNREIDGTTLDLEILSDQFLTGGGSRWDRTTGVAVDGPYDGRRLDQANAVSALFWFAWLDFEPQTELYRP